MKQSGQPFMTRVSDNRSSFTPKERILADFILKNPGKVVFMTTKELAAASGVSEATVIRFVTHLQYNGYTDFLQELRSLMDRDLTLVDRLDLSERKGKNSERLRTIITKEIENLKHLYDVLDMDAADQAIDLLQKSPTVFVIGSRLSYTLAYYLWWSLIKVRQSVNILKGSDTSAIDLLTVAPPGSLVVAIATTRYPNDLIKTCKYARRLGHSLLLIADGGFCPLIQFATVKLVVPPQNIPYFGSSTTLSCLANYLVHELASRNEEALRKHQEKLEQCYLENDLLFNIGANSY